MPHHGCMQPISLLPSGEFDFETGRVRALNPMKDFQGERLVESGPSGAWRIAFADGRRFILAGTDGIGHQVYYAW